MSPPMSPPTRQRGGSLSTPRAWLSRTTSSKDTNPAHAPYAPSKPVRISEPRFANGLDILAQQRSGVLGAGATIVRTPQDALSPSATRPFSPFRVHEDDANYGVRTVSSERAPARSKSPPLPPIPDVESFDAVRSKTPPHPTRAPPLMPESEGSEITVVEPVSLRPSLKMRSPAPSEYSPPVPALPLNLSSSPPQPPFQPILLGPLPAGPVDPSKTIVSLETSTITHRTTMSTLVSRPSYLASYLQDLFPPRTGMRDSTLSTISDVSENESSFNSIFHHHLKSTGVIPTSQPPATIHIFLDRPSAPYAHIISYLRTPPSTPEHPAVLPRAVQLASNSSSRLDALLELRDEACYLELDELYKLCNDELRQRQSRMSAISLHVRGFSSGASSSSIRSVNTLQEIAEMDDHDKLRSAGRARSKDSGFASMETKRSLRGINTAVDSAASQTAISPTSMQQRILPSERGRAATRQPGAGLLASKPSPGWI
ncbi:uncharacterized protein LAESUDRAFT_733152 [Laetiporus sulphureus 93-53]|uniref:BTB domain-containing protein n=1 Tax=Laetiporus sulphureus 93-53 TaxID=1314785 RepID=A0A165I1H3_9APHY|nr:uncharacterized protein LAESUDRAFT_733152 [Laetiporus sulphureus 93-53]KZT12469.1 hypothetical protein LAESUDRAFT_733152 [Laetiporus sulphureus 93-53]